MTCRARTVSAATDCAFVDVEDAGHNNLFASDFEDQGVFT